MRIVDQPLPARRRARLLEVDAHHDQQVIRQLRRLRAQPPRIVECRIDVVDAAGPDHDEQPIVHPIEDLGCGSASAQHHTCGRCPEWLVLEHCLWCGERCDPLDPLVAHEVEGSGSSERHGFLHQR